MGEHHIEAVRRQEALQTSHEGELASQREAHAEARARWLAEVAQSEDSEQRNAFVRHQEALRGQEEALLIGPPARSGCGLLALLLAPVSSLRVSR